MALTNLSLLIPWALPVGALLAYLVLVRAELLMLVLIAILPWQGALRYPTENLTVAKLVGALLLISVLSTTLIADRPLRFPPVLWAAAALCSAVTVSLCVNSPSTLSVTETLRYWTLTLFVFLIVQLIDSHAAFMRALRVLALSAIVGAAWAATQFIGGSVPRASGPISDPNDFAYFLAAVLPLVAYLFMVERQRRWLWGAGLLCLALGILGASSRGAFVALAVTAAWAVLARRVAPIVVAGAVVSAALTALLVLAISTASTSQNLQVRQHSLSTSVEFRKSYWSAAERIAEDHPLFGAGPASFQVIGPDYARDAPGLESKLSVNNTYLTMLSENGALASAAFLAFLVTIWLQISPALTPARAHSRGAQLPARAHSRGAQLDRERDATAERAGALRLRTALQAAFLIALVGGIFFSAQLSTPFWLIAALAPSARLARQQPHRVQRLAERRAHSRPAHT
ncbi:MAG TPA: O-antigen ligase family protein [Solirubrobacteraceae bacterium]|nr:O-antigen ligase family protein [Solirubrobacteraceae bacterium]